MINLFPGSAAFPPRASQSLQKAIPSYLYDEFNDDDDLAAFVSAYNGLAQIYVDWFNEIELPIYTGLSGALLDWVGQSPLYGIARPTLYSNSPESEGLIASDELALLEIADFEIINNISNLAVTSDDVYQRILTWYAYDGDGRQFSAQWLRRRVARFIYGGGGADFSAPVQNVSIIYGGGNLAITIISGICEGIDGLIAQDEIGDLEIGAVDTVLIPVAVPTVAPIFCEAVNTGALELPSKFTVTCRIGIIGI